MVDPSEAEEQNKCKGPQLDKPAVNTQDPREPEHSDGTATEDDGDAGFETPPTGSSEPSPCHTATPSQPPQAASQGTPPEQPQTERDLSPKLHLDLYNFDTPVAEGSRYVLTSPRSLEACARCGVKPVELLARPLADFAREAPGRSMRVATGMFEVYERDRHGKLRQCREERERIVREEKRRILQAAANTNGSTSTVSSGSTQPPKSGAVTSSSVSGSGSSSRSTAPCPSTKTGATHLSKPSPLTLNTSPKPTQSSKTASVSSTPSSKGILLGSAKHPMTSSPERVKKPRPLSSGPPPVIRKSSGGKSAHTFPRSTPKLPSFVRAKSTLTSSVSKPAVQSAGTPLNGVTGGPFSQHNGHLGFHSKVRGKSHSLESLQRRMDTVCSPASNTTTTTTCTSSESGASSSYSWEGVRDQWAKVSSPRARTLATFNSLMGRSLSLGDLSHSPQTTQKVERIVREVRRQGLKAVSERDRKIAALMLARYQEEDIMSQTRYVAHLQWDSEKRVDEIRREQEDREKQRAVLQCQRVWQAQVSTRQRRLTQQERDAAATKLRQAEENEGRWKELAEQQERSRLQRLQQAAREEKHKKTLQEQNLKALEEERSAMLEQERLLLKEKLTMAELKRQEKEHQAQEDRLGLNKAERRRHAAIIQEIARREEEEVKEARRAAEVKLNRSLENYEQIVERRGQEMKEKAKREEKQIQKARKAAERRERQQQLQLEARAREAEKRAQQAATVAEERAKEKAQRAVQCRQEKEKLQRHNRQRVEEEEKQRRMELLQSIEKKLEKSEQIFREKRAVLESARSVARASFHVRDKVREETNMRTFDKMALEAQLKASMDEK
ncbi:coiled-coil domain-containing protein 177 [Genypterus blacodes]|uniref:coiled-coil domain-containing protein 177 n=1 Tax=Genypterus blacodes TaxID=154954 RepID=UPI003F762FD5